MHAYGKTKNKNGLECNGHLCFWLRIYVRYARCSESLRKSLNSILSKSILWCKLVRFLVSKSRAQTAPPLFTRSSLLGGTAQGSRMPHQSAGVHIQLGGFLPTATIMSAPSDTPCCVSCIAFLNSSRTCACDPGNSLDLRAARTSISSKPSM